MALRLHVSGIERIEDSNPLTQPRWGAGTKEEATDSPVDRIPIDEGRWRVLKA